jgi:hypothetical protein
VEEIDYAAERPRHEARDNLGSQRGRGVDLFLAYFHLQRESSKGNHIIPCG